MRWLLIIFLAGFFMANCTNQTKMNPPVAKKIAHYDTTFDDVRLDNYHWMRDRDNPEVLNYLKEENKYTKAMMAHTEDLREMLYKEMLGRIKETDSSVPVRRGEYFYYSRTEQGKQYRIHCRKKGSLEAEEEIILDENELAQGHKFFDIGVFSVSPNHQWLAFSFDTTGSETFTIRIKDLDNGNILDDEIPNTYYSLAWANDNQTIFYNTLDAAKRPFKLYRHKIGTKAENDKLIYHEKDEKFFLSASRTRSGQYILMNLGSEVTSEVRYLNADQPEGTFKVFAPRKEKIEYSIDHRGKEFYILTNEQAVNFKLMKTPVKRTAKKYWQEVIPGRLNVKLEKIELFNNYLVVFERDNGLEKIRVIDFVSGKNHFVDFEEPVYAVYPTGNREFDTDVLRFAYSSLITPKSVYDYNMSTKQRELKKREEVLGGYDPAQYQMERIWATAPDGVKVPMSIVYKKGLKKDGQNPTYLYGYGSYGITIEPRFSSNRFSLIDRGFIYAIAHIRGGGMLGRPWYEDGKLLKKKNTFTDFIACAEHLVKEKYTSPEKISIAGGSAGGLLMGAVVNMRPDLFKAAIAHVPFVDVLNTMLDPTIPLTVIEYDEWGNPNIKEYYDYIKSYSPYDNVTAQKYPHMLVTAGLNDPRVQYWEPAKWTAKLRATKTDQNLLLLKTNMGAGHMGASGRYDYLKEIAFDYAFILDRLGVEE